MKRIIALLLALSPLSALAAANYTLTCTDKRMHAGDLVPYGTYTVSNGTAFTGAPSSIFVTPGPALCTTTATSASPVGTYTLTASTGTLTNPGTDTVAYVNGTLTIEAPDGIGATLTNNVTYPAGWANTSLQFGMPDVTSNPVANLVGDGVTDNTAGMIRLLNLARGGSDTHLSCAGTTSCAWVSGTHFNGIGAGLPFYINGLIFVTAAGSTANTLNITTPGPVTGNLNGRLPPWTISTDGTTATITASQGPPLNALAVNTRLQIQSTFYTVAAVVDATHVTLNAVPPLLTNVNMYNGALVEASTGQYPLYLYFPPGEYCMSNSLPFYGNYWSIWGAGAQTSSLCLLPNSPSANGTSPLEFLYSPPFSTNDYHQHVRNMSIHIKAGNPLAWAISSEINNEGAFRNDIIYNDDSHSAIGISLQHTFPGPAMFKNIAVYGFQSGITGGQPEYSETFESINVEGQEVSGITDNDLKFSVRHMLGVENSAQVITENFVDAAMTLMDSEMFSAAPICIQNSKNAGQASILYVSNTTATGCATTIVDYGSGTLVNTTGNISQYSTNAAHTLFDGSSPWGPSPITVKETPVPADGNPSTWTNLTDTFSNWQSILNASSSPTAYLVPHQVVGDGQTYNITIPDTINHINFGDVILQQGTSVTLIFTVAGTSSTALTIEGCILVSCQFVHTGSRAISFVDDDNIISYSSAPGAGDLYIDDSILGSLATGNTLTVYASQHVYARQLDIEPTTATKWICNGAQLWVLGFKTEHDGANLQEINGCQANIFGGFVYPLSTNNAGVALTPSAGQEFLPSSVNICPFNFTGSFPCSPAVILYKDAALTIPLTQPFTSDAWGNYTVFVPPVVTATTAISTDASNNETVTFANPAPCIVGQNITVAGAVPAGLNATKAITAVSGNSITFVGTLASTTATTQGTATSNSSYNHVEVTPTGGTPYSFQAIADVNHFLTMVPAVFNVTDSSLFLSTIFTYPNTVTVGWPYWVSEIRSGNSRGLLSGFQASPGSISSFYSLGAGSVIAPPLFQIGNFIRKGKF